MFVSFDYHGKSAFNKIADACLQPTRYLFAMNTIQVTSRIPLGSSQAEHIFEQYKFSRSWKKTALAIALFIPGFIIGVLAKSLVLCFSKENKSIHTNYKNALRDGNVQLISPQKDSLALMIFSPQYAESAKAAKKRLERSYEKIVSIKSTDFDKSEIEKLAKFDLVVIRRMHAACKVFNLEGTYSDNIRDLYQKAEKSTVIFSPDPMWIGGVVSKNNLETLKKNQPDLANFIVETPTFSA